ncbi:hypothetical protein MTP99_012711 [Tenebrio molitor]|nr:hypothetical protein MTP99_012711 [Tenebrio molitor]
MIAQHFNREKYILIGHSYGGQLAYTFSQLYPEYVEKLVTLDVMHFSPEEPKDFEKRVRNKLDYCIATCVARVLILSLGQLEKPNLHRNSLHK